MLFRRSTDPQFMTEYYKQTVMMLAKEISVCNHDAAVQKGLH